MSGHDWMNLNKPYDRAGVYYWKCGRCGTNRTIPNWAPEPEHPDARAKRLGHDPDESCDERVAQSVTES